RPGTPAAVMPDQVPAEVVQERYERLVALGNDISWDENKTFVGQTVEVLVATGEGRKDEATGRVSGRARDYRLVHVTKTDATGQFHNIRPGDIVTARVTHAAPHHLIADELLSVRPTTAGDMFEAGSRPVTEGEKPARTSGLITLGPVS
ncbi:MAG: TRAM domain-containing protein, partial [Actinobacteria bacterium]|nr:TRAM domain-containing protein [Actinomycetota bacterium]